METMTEQTKTKTRFGASKLNPSCKLALANSGVARIEGISLIQFGVEALGHALWVDEVFAQQLVGQVNALPKGLKARYTHPGLFADGLGTFLGRVSNARIEGDKVLGDLTFSEAARRAPQGNLVEYVATLADEDPEAAGFSIDFWRDITAEEATPPSNPFGYPHARLHTIRSVDLVDEPAANRRGMFASGNADEVRNLVVQELSKLLKDGQLAASKYNAGMETTATTEQTAVIDTTTEAQAPAETPVEKVKEQPTETPQAPAAPDSQLSAILDLVNKQNETLSALTAQLAAQKAEVEMLKHSKGTALATNAAPPAVAPEGAPKTGKSIFTRGIEKIRR